MNNIIIFLLFFLLPLFSGNSMAENRIFPGYSSTVSRLDMDLAIFDLSVNRLGILNVYPLNFIKSISSDSESNKKIRCFVVVDNSILKGSDSERRNRLEEFCKFLFKEFQGRFYMLDSEYVKKNGDIGTPAVKMNEHNIHLYIHSNSYKPLFLAEWESGSMSYKNDFLDIK